MVRITFTVLALSVSALAATMHNRRDIDVRAEPEMLGRAVPVMALDRRQDNNKAPESEQVKALKEEINKIDPKLTEAKNKAQEAQKEVKAAFESLPQEQKDALKAKQKEVKEAKKAQKQAAAPAPAEPAAPAPSA